MTRTPRILLMDDDADLCVLSARMASAIGAELDSAEDGDEALAKFAAARAAGRAYDAVILDASIPGGRGAAELVGVFKAEAPSIPVILTSGWSHGGLLTDYEAHGFSAVLEKPFDRQRFAEVLDLVLDPSPDS